MAKRLTRSSSKTQELTEIEKERCATIERNAKKFEELNLPHLAKQMMERKLQLVHNKGKEKKSLNARDEDYQPDEEVEVRDGFDDDEDLSGGVNKRKIDEDKVVKLAKKKKPLCSSMSMEEFIKMQQQTELIEHETEGEPSQIEEELSRANVDHAMVPLENLDLDVLSDVEPSHMSAKAKEKQGRGPTCLYDVHARSLEDRVTVTFNDDNQPIGPTDKVVNEFVRFLGTMAHDHTWAPLTYTNWKKVPDKEEMWKYVNKKYIIPSSTEPYVYATIGELWKLFKCRMKKEHYSKYTNFSDRLKHRPSRIPLAHFKICCRYWDTEYAKTTKKGEPPSKREIFEETRRRKPGRKYKKAYDDTHDKIEKMKQLETLQEAGLESDVDVFEEVMNKEHPGRLRLLGRGVTRKSLKEKQVGTSSCVLPSEVIESIRNATSDLDAQKESLQAERIQMQAEREQMQAEREKMQAEREKLAKEMEALAELSKVLKAQARGSFVENEN